MIPSKRLIREEEHHNKSDPRLVTFFTVLIMNTNILH